jgi:hypothetical protein
MYPACFAATCTHKLSCVHGRSVPGEEYYPTGNKHYLPASGKLDLGAADALTGPSSSWAQDRNCAPTHETQTAKRDVREGRGKGVIQQHRRHAAGAVAIWRMRAVGLGLLSRVVWPRSGGGGTLVGADDQGLARYGGTKVWCWCRCVKIGQMLTCRRR